MSNSTEILIGADPEVFLVNNVRLISSIGLIGGSKYEPKDYGDGISLQEDNVAVEWNIPPCKTAEEFVRFNTLAMEKILQVVKSKGLFLGIQASGMFDDDQLAHPAAKEFGCEPDFNAWTYEPNPRPKANAKLRSCGGHVHIGVGNFEPEGCFNIVKIMDAICGVPLSLLDKDRRRRELYGKAGACRPKPYGVEYRTLSNYWLTNEDLMKFVFECAQNAARLKDDSAVVDAVKRMGPYIQSAINESHEENRRKVLEVFDEFIPTCAQVEEAMYA